MVEESLPYGQPGHQLLPISYTGPLMTMGPGLDSWLTAHAQGGAPLALP